MIDSELTPMQTTIVQIFDKIANDFERWSAGGSRDNCTNEIKLSTPFSSDSVVLDIGCGPGIFIEELQRQLSSKSTTKDAVVKVIAVDPSSKMLDVVKQKSLQAPSTWPNLRLEIQQDFAENLPKFIPDNTLTHAYTNFTIDFFLDPDAVCQNIHHALAPGGTAIFTCRAEEDVIPIIRRTEKSINPGNREFPDPMNREWQDPNTWKAFLERGGFDTAKIDIFKKDCFMHASSLEEMSSLVVETWLCHLRPGGWSSDDERKKWLKPFEKELIKDACFIDRGEKGVAIRMNMLYVSATK